MNCEQRIDKCFVRELEVTALSGENVKLLISQKWIGDVGVVVWDSALMFSKFLERRSQLNPQYFRNKVALELGAGTGICGLVASVLGCDVILTDIPSIVPLLETNIENNKDLIALCGRKVVAHSWKWASFDTFEQVLRCLESNTMSLDYVFISDCIYYEQGMHSLIESIIWLCERFKNSLEIYLCYEEREEHSALVETFFRSLSSTSTISWTEIGAEEHDPCFTSPDIHLILIKPVKQ
ncbi:protein-lysine methyltransferase METTL21D-like protein [Leptotrombidium deliense]|uniref:Protein-lysine methyltransferase METTL21D-like protein n=1 Tax=Leptotrombidium deliense TaxID=299467 RepID=A0A443SVQ6_9ACAR|nr:protein-lysine methyltransferase METTL21D-like protein [Leptotrombidium deliense]